MVWVGLVRVSLLSSSIKVGLCLTCREATSPTTMELVESPSMATSLLMRTSRWSTAAKASCPWPTPGRTLTDPSSSSARSRRHGKNTCWRFAHRWEMKTVSFRITFLRGGTTSTGEQVSNGSEMYWCLKPNGFMKEKAARGRLESRWFSGRVCVEVLWRTKETRSACSSHHWVQMSFKQLVCTWWAKCLCSVDK